MKRDYVKDLELRKKLLNWFRNNPLSEDAVKLAISSMKQGGKILVFGNGGSATQASHFAAELVNRFDFNRRALAAISLTADIANLTSIANDRDYSDVFSRQVEAVGNSGDVAIGISTSGTSGNVIKGLAKAKEKGLKTIGLCGNNSDELSKMNLDMIIAIPSDDTPAIQEMHLFVLHRIAGGVEWEMGRN